MRELPFKAKISDNDLLSKTNPNLEDSDSITNASVILTNMENIIRKCRLLIMTDNIQNKPRKIILDTKRDNFKNTPPRIKEAGRLFEIVFGNFCLSSKVDGFKLHIIKNPAEVIVSKLFNVPYNSIFYDNKAFYRKVSPDSGHNQSLSSNSSFNSISSSNMSPSSSGFLNPLSGTSNESINSNLSLPRSTSRYRGLVGSQLSSTSSLVKDGMKNSSNNFFNETFDICNYRSKVMMSAVLIFSLPDENKAEFEEFIFQYYTVLESVVNRIARVILDDCHSIYNGSVINCWKQSRRWIVSLLPRHSSVLSSSGVTSSSVQLSRSTPKKWLNVQMFEEVVNFYSKERRLGFLADIISAVIVSSPNASSKYLKNQSCPTQHSFPYSLLLQNLGVDVQNQSFNRIIVKSLTKIRRILSSSSWKNRLSMSLTQYKKMWNSQVDSSSISCSDMDISSRGMALISESLTRTVSDNTMTNDYRELHLIIALVADLIRPVTMVAYQSHVLPSDMPILTNNQQCMTKDGSLGIEVPLLDNGLVLAQEILPDNSEMFFPSVIADQIASSLVPLQGYIHSYQGNDFESQLMLESRRSEVIHIDTTYRPQFLVIDVDASTVTVQSKSSTQSAWIKDLLETFAVLIKVDGYDSVLGELFLDSAFANLSQKLHYINEECSDIRSKREDTILLELNGLTDSDSSLLLRKYSQ